MKKYNFIIILIIMVTSLYSCQTDGLNQYAENQEISVVDMETYYSVEEVTNIIESITVVNRNNAPSSWFQKIKSFVKRITGSNLFDNCKGSNSCGPCAGICFRFNSANFEITDGDQVSLEAYENDYRALGISLIQNTETNNEEIVFIFNKYAQDFIIDDLFYIESDIIVEGELLEVLQKEYIKFFKGKYHVIYDEVTGDYYSLIKSKIK